MTQFQNYQHLSIFAVFLKIVFVSLEKWHVMSIMQPQSLKELSVSWKLRLNL